jgi:hypothetical protein
MFDQAIADQICDRIAEGEPLRQICRLEGFPAWRTVYLWQEQNADFAARIARARVSGFDAIAEECLEIADDTRYDTRTSGSGDNEREVANAEWIGRSKVRIETRLKLLAKWDPRRYGEKLELAGNQDSPLTVVVKRLTDA